MISPIREKPTFQPTTPKGDMAMNKKIQYKDENESEKTRHIEEVENMVRIYSLHFLNFLTAFIRNEEIYSLHFLIFLSAFIRNEYSNSFLFFQKS